jgi:hypothetical protein
MPLTLLILTALPAAAQAPLNRTVGNAVFAYGRTRYFRDLTRAHHCERFDAKQFSQVNARFEVARQALIARFGEMGFAEEDARPAPIAPGPCDPSELASFATHIGEMEQAAKAP